MIKKIFIIVFAVILFSLSACNQSKNQKETKQNNQLEKTEVAKKAEDDTVYSSVNDIFVKGDSLVNKTIYVEGIVEHVCKHSQKRFKIVGNNENQFIKIELGENFKPVDADIVGKNAKIKGKLIPIKLDAKDVLQWEARMKKNHKGEEDTQHYKEELAFIQGIYKQIIDGEILYYTNYAIEAEAYDLK